MWTGVAGGASWLLTLKGNRLEWACGAQKVRGMDPGAWLHRYLRLDESMKGVAQEWGSSQGDLLDQSYKALEGLRLLRQEPFECTVSYMFAQGLSVAVISQAVEKLCHAFGRSLPPPPGVSGVSFHDFPDSKTLASLDAAQLKPFVNNYHARGERILRVAAAVDSGVLKLERLSTAPLMEAREALMALDGIGPKIADCILLFSLEQPSAFPLDRWVIRALGLHGSFRKPLQGFHGTLPLKRYLLLADAAHKRFGDRCGLAGEYMFLFLRVQDDPALRRRLFPETAEPHPKSKVLKP
jgi:N-glycosylase/DNA lyase